MKYTVFISLFAGCTAFAPITRKTSSGACSSFAAPNKYNSVAFVPAVVHNFSSTALNMELDTAVSIVAGLCGIFGAYLLIKNDIKADVEKGFTAIDKNLLELKEDVRKDVNELKLMSILGLVLFGAIFYVRIDAKIH
jgi:hypothetical protein